MRTQWEVCISLLCRRFHNLIDTAVYERHLQSFRLLSNIHQTLLIAHLKKGIQRKMMAKSINLLQPKTLETPRIVDPEAESFIASMQDDSDGNSAGSGQHGSATEKDDSDVNDSDINDSDVNNSDVGDNDAGHGSSHTEE